MEFNQALPDGGMLFGLGPEEYIKAIQNSPPNTLIFVGDLSPAPMVRCLGCGAEMDECLKDAHTC